MSIGHVAAFSGTETGTYSSTKAGSGTFSRSVSGKDGNREVDTTFTNADGKVVTRDVTRTKTGTGYTRSVTTTLADNKQTTLNETATKQADGSYAITGSFTGENGKTQSVSGTASDSSTGAVTDLSFTNAANQTRTVDSTKTGSFDQNTRTVQGTNFNGVPFSTTSALAVLQSQASS